MKLDDIARAATLLALAGDDAERAAPSSEIRALIAPMRSSAMQRALLLLAVQRLDPDAEVKPSHTGAGAVLTMFAHGSPCSLTILGRELPGRIADALRDDTASALWHRLRRAELSGGTVR